MMKVQNKSNITITKAQLEDLNGVEELYNDICDFLADKEYNPGWRKGCFPTRNEAEYFYTRDALYVAKEENSIVGSIALTYSSNAESDESLQYHTEESKDILYIHEFVVHPKHQRKGIGTMLLDFAEKYGRSQDVKVIQLNVYEKNSVAIKAYEKSGFSFVEKVDIGLGQFGLEWFCLYKKEL